MRTASLNVIKYLLFVFNILFVVRTAAELRTLCVGGGARGGRGDLEGMGRRLQVQDTRRVPRRVVARPGGTHRFHMARSHTLSSRDVDGCRAARHVLIWSLACVGERLGCFLGLGGIGAL